MARSRFRVPHTLVLLFAMIVLAYLLTLVLPPGEYRKITNDHDRQQVVPGSFERIAEPERLSPLAILTAIPAGFTGAEEIIFFVFIIGGALAIFRATGAADGAIGVLLKRLGHRPALLIAGGVLVFALGSATIGMAEEYIPFVAILVALAVGLGFDAVTAVGILCIGYGVGYGAAILNPFTVIIAQDVAGLEPSSGLGYRLVLLLVFFLIGFHHLWSYAKKIRQDPSRSLVADIEVDPALKTAGHPDLTGTHKLVLAVMLAALVLLVVGIKFWGWYLVEMGALFLGLSLVLGMMGRLGWDGTAKTFCAGAAELTTTALLIGFARSIQVVLDQGKVVDTLIHGIAQPLQQMGSAAASVGMLVVQSMTNLFIPSGSGQAYVTMPIMAPLADLVGVERQVAVLAYQFGDGFTNILVPTNAVLIGILAIAGVPYDRWFRFILPFMLKIWAAAALALVVAVWMGYQ